MSYVNKKRTYVSLFSSAGIGCYGFKMQGFDCIVTNEILESRMEIQKLNDKCSNESGYIVGDILDENIKGKILNEIEKYKKKTKKDIDVIVATPPCQGMSNANYKKKNELSRNSLVVEAIRMISIIKPKIFIIENVQSFLKSTCNMDGKLLTIKEAIFGSLQGEYEIYYKILNFRDYGVPSSRPRILVIGTSKKIKDISPLNLFPLSTDLITLEESIGHLKKLDWGEIDNNDVFHFFREYPSYMKSWIENIKPGKSAFQNDKDNLPYRIVNGVKQPLKGGYLGNKFKRLNWNSCSSCITTRSDQLASQQTIHPSENRVLSIRELMILMSIPSEFRWTNKDSVINDESIKNKKIFLKKNELKIRRCIGEAVPTIIFAKIAKNINDLLDYCDYISGERNVNVENNFYIRTLLFEKKIRNKKDRGAFYTPQSVVFNSLKKINVDNIDEKSLNILDPSVGCGSFLPAIINLFDRKKINLTLIDIDVKTINELKDIINLIPFNANNVSLSFVCTDFLCHNFYDKKYDFIITNPPFYKLKNIKNISFLRDIHRKDKLIKNIYGFFLYKSFSLSDKIIFILPKSFANAPEFNNLRNCIQKLDYKIISIIDYGISFFNDVFIEIISIYLEKNNNLTNDVFIENKERNILAVQPMHYIIHNKIWIFYRNVFFDDYYNSLITNIFNVTRDRQITNKYLKNDGKIRVLRSKNIANNGDIIKIDKYDKFVDSIEGFNIKKFLNNENCIIFVNFTYNTRAAFLPKNCIVNGSLAILSNSNNNILIDKNDLLLYSTKEFREYYAILRNYSKFTLNIDSNLVHYIGIKKNGR